MDPDFLRELLTPPEFEEWAGLATEHWPTVRRRLRHALLKYLWYWQAKERNWDNRVGERHLPRGGLPESGLRIKTMRPSDYGERGVAE